MTVTDLIAILALVISSGTFAIEAKRWFDEGPKLHMSVMGDALFIPDDDGRDKLVLTVINRGDTPTTITHMIAFVFDSRWKRLINKPSMTGVVNSTLQPIPSSLGINATFQGVMVYDDKLTKARSRGLLFVGVISTHSSKNFLIQVPPKKPEKHLSKMSA